MPGIPKEKLATIWADGRVEGNEGICEALRRIVDAGKLTDKVETEDGPELRDTPIKSPFFMYRLANYFNLQMGNLRFMVFE